MSSKLGIVKELMLEKNELAHLQQFLTDDNVNNLKNNSALFGVISNVKADPQFNNFKITSGSSSGTIALPQSSIGIDKDGLYIVQESFDNVAITDGTLFHIVISQQYKHVEVGTVSITSDGIVTGIGTLFTAVMRGQPLFPTKLKFYGSSTNTGEYQVVEVASDSSMKLAGTFSPESGLRYSVIGTFSPTAVIASDDKEIYYYDSCLFRIIDDTTYSGMTFVDGKEFTIATALNTSGVVEIKDLRTDIYTTSDKIFIDASANVHIYPVVVNPVIGIESIKWDSSFATKDKNELSVSWGFRSSNWTMEPSLRKVTITSGEGGKYKTSGQFVTGDFDGWRLYNIRGDYKLIVSSTKSGTSINLIVQSLDIDEYTSGDQIMIVPDVEEVTIITKHDGSSTDIPLIDNRYTFPVNTDVAKIYLLVPSISSYLYNITYQYKRFNRYSQPALMPDDSIGYYDETSYTEGVLNSNPLDRVRVPYTSVMNDGYIMLKPNPNSYAAVVGRVDTGDVFGVRKIALSTPLFNPTFPLFIGTDLQYQNFVGSTYTMTADSPLELKKTKFDGSPLRNGNFFLLHFQQNITDGGGTKFFRIVQDYVNSSTYTLLYEFNANDYLFLNGGSPKGIFIRCTFYTDGVDPSNDTWIVNFTNETAVVQMQLDLAAAESNIALLLPVLGSWVDLDPTLMVFKGYDSSVDGAGSNVITTAPVVNIDYSPFYSPSTTPSVFRYRLNGKTVIIDFNFQLTWTVTSIDVARFELTLPAPLNSIKGISVGNYQLGHNSSDEFPSGVQTMYARDNKLKFLCKTGLYTRQSFAFFATTYQYSVSVPNIVQVATAGSGTLKNTFAGQITLELN